MTAVCDFCAVAAVVLFAILVLASQEVDAQQ